MNGCVPVLSEIDFFEAVMAKYKTLEAVSLFCVCDRYSKLMKNVEKLTLFR